MDRLMRHPRAFTAALLGLAVLTTFGLAAGDSMFLASADSVHRLPLLSSWRHLPSVFSADFLMFSEGKLRPLSYGLMALVRSVVDVDSTLVWHLLLVLVHWANAILLTRLVSHFTNGLWSPLFGGLLFAIHPLASVIANDAGLLHHLLTPTLYLASLLCFLRPEQGERTRGRCILSLSLFAVGLLVSKVAFTIPVLLATFEGVYLRAGWRRTARALAPFVAVGLVVAPLWWVLRPVSPISQKFSLAGSRSTRPGSRSVRLAHSPSASSSASTPSPGLPSNTVAHRRSFSRPYPSVTSSHAHSMASALK